MSLPTIHYNVNLYQRTIGQYLIDNGWKQATPETGMGETTYFKIEGGSKKQANIGNADVKFFFSDRAIYTAKYDEVLSEVNSLLIYFIQE